MTATPRERVLALIEGRQPDRVPTDYWATPEFDARLKAELNCPDNEALWRKLHIDAPLRLAPRAIHTHHPDDPQADMWGVRHRSIRYGTGSYEEVAVGPLAHVTNVQQVHAFRWPSPDDLDYTAITRARELAVLVGTRKALSIAVRTADTAERHTALAERLRQPEKTGVE